ncbi:MAG TPA: metallophosphoesterase [Bryobacteraceae bacterium]|nr:metallophosphoesterase [Bryobacteraceae bacterium]
MSIFSIVLLILGVSQLYWAWRGYRFATAHIQRRAWRWGVCAAVLVVWVVLYRLNIGSWRERATPVRLTLYDALLVAPFWWWAASSLVGFLVAMVFAIPQSIVGGARWLARWRAAHRTRPELSSPPRRAFLERTAAVATGAPFVAGVYGLFYGRLNLEIAPQTIRLPRLPRAFEGFRICQLSDIHIGPFMTAQQIRKYADIANAQKADMIVLTGDFVTFDPDTQGPVVDALRGLRAPFGVYGSLGNHDAWAGVEKSITELFRQAGIRILRGTNVPIAEQGEQFNLIGVDFQSQHGFGPSPPVAHLLANIEGLVDRDRVNILMSHNPDTFDRAAQLGIDLSLAGHTHGGQAALEFISPELAPSRLITPYVAGWFQRPGGQLYVNRGIGTVFVPIRIGAPPEITVYSLTRG